MADEDFHEIQLSGKQLVFLFVTAAGVLVVAFLCGVLVGRGVRSQKDQTPGMDIVAQTAPGPGEAPLATTPAGPPASAPPVASSSGQPPPEDELSYYSRLKEPSAPPEKPAAADGPAGGPAGKPPGQGQEALAAKGGTRSGEAAPARPAPAVPSTPAPAGGPAAGAGLKAPDAAASGEPPGAGFSLRVVAYKDRAQADAVASRLAGKGYNTYVVSLSTRGVALHSVRVGKFKTRREADAARRRLEKEEQFTPSIIR